MYDIIIVDDEKDIRTLLSGILTDEGYGVRNASNSQEFFDLLKGRLPSLILLDIWLKKSDMDGIEILHKMSKSYPDIPVIMISGHGTVDIAVRAMQAGAFNFLEKPIKLDYLLLLVERALNNKKIAQEHKDLITKQVGIPCELMGTSPAILNIHLQIQKHASGNGRVLISGENGTGQQTLARKIHDMSPRSKFPFVNVSCKNKNVTDIEKEIFGCNDMNNPNMPSFAGAIELAHNGTLFIDGIEYLSKSTQQKLTKFMVEKQFARIMSADKTVESDVRIMASCDEVPENAVNDGRLSNDFFNRLNVVRFDMPPLRERREDIVILIENITNEIASLHHFAVPEYEDDVLVTLQIFDWQGNIKQLRNVIESLIIKSAERKNPLVTLDDLPYELRHGDVSASQSMLPYYINLPLREAREAFEREYLITKLSFFKGNISKTAQFIGMERSALHRKLRGLGVSSRYHIPDDECSTE